MGTDGVRPSDRLAILAALGLIPGAWALVAPLAGVHRGHGFGLGVLVAFDLLLIVVVLRELRALPGPAAFAVVRSVKTPVALGARAFTSLSITSTWAGRVFVIDEPPPNASGGVNASVRLVVDVVRQVGAEVLIPARGDHAFGPVNIVADGPLGLLRRRICIETSGDRTLRVVPAIGVGDGRSLDPRLLLRELGVKPVRRKEEGTEVHGLRDAVPEDPMRRIDWRATLRRGVPVARVYRPEQDHDVVICVDTGRLMGARHDAVHSKLDLALEAMLKVSAVALAAGDRVGVLTFARSVGRWVPPQARRVQLGRLRDATYAAQPAEADASFSVAMRAIERRQRRRGLIIFLTDFVDDQSVSPMVDAVGALARRHAVLLVALRDRPPATEPIEGVGSALRSVAGLARAEARNATFATLRRLGVDALDLPADAVSAVAIRRYLALRGSGRA